MDISKPYTRVTKETKENFDKGWEAIFGKKNKFKKKKNGVLKRDNKQ
jgi:hypothetical protein